MAAKKKARPEFVTHPLGTEIYTVEQVAAALSLSPKYIYKAIQEGRLEAKKTGKQFLITREDVRKFWESLPSTSKGTKRVTTSFTSVRNEADLVEPT